MNSLVSFLGRQLYALNPSLLPTPPEQEGSDKDICFLGPNGEDNVNVTYCGDLDYGMRPNVGSWYLSPDRHVAEGLFVLVFFGSILFVVQSMLTKQISVANKTIRHPVWMKPVTLVCFGMIMIYKSYGHTNKMFYLVMPCNMKWILSMILCFGPKSYRHVALELICSYIGLAMVAITMPDTKDTVLLGELPFFFANHTILLLIPLAYIYNGSITLRTSFGTHFLWWVVACCWFALFYFPVVTVLSAISGLNLNYMMHPPPNQNFVAGDWYRWYSSGLCAGMFAFSRFVVWLAELIIPKQIRSKEIKMV